MTIAQKSFFENPVPRPGSYHQPAIFLLDISESMGWETNEDIVPIDELNEGLQSFIDSWKDDELGEVIDISLVTFNDRAQVVQDFMPAQAMRSITFEAKGRTALGAAINLALDKATEYKNKLKHEGVDYYRPWIICISDGAPTDTAVVTSAAQRLKAAEDANQVVAYCIGVDGFDGNKMSEIFNPYRILVLRDFDFSELFVFLRNSMVVSVSQAEATGKIEVPLPDAIETFTFNV